jgi:murein DD-endopeptidase MepM/ murein hydrolase activator NlpD
VDPTYRFGSTAGGVREPHTGVEFQAPAGDAVLAAAKGTVAAVVREDQVPAPGLGFGYGNMVIVQHTQPGSDVPVYSVYGHLSEISVVPGQEVLAGTIIGRVGATGVATGPHLHFEVRLSSDLQADTRNPELWLLPWREDAGESSGAMAGIIQTADGGRVDVVGIVIQPVDPVSGKPSLPAVYLQTYANSTLHGDDTWGENFATGDLQPGQYRVAFSYGGKVYSSEAPVQAGQLTMIRITVDSP